MSDASQALAWIDQPGAYAYAVVTADGRVYNFTSGAFEAMPATPATAHLKTMTAKKFGAAQWSQDVLPSILAQAQQLVALYYSVDPSGKILSYAGMAVLGNKGSGITIIQQA